MRSFVAAVLAASLSFAAPLQAKEAKKPAKKEAAKDSKSKDAKSKDDKAAFSMEGKTIEMDMRDYILGGVLGTTVGFGIGHAVQGRYKQKGWLFTVLQVASLGLIIYGLSDCESSSADDESSGDDDVFDDLVQLPRTKRPALAEDSCPGAGAAIVGFGTLIGFHVWEIVDVWSKPKRNPANHKFYAQDDGRLSLGFTAIRGQEMPERSSFVPAMQSNLVPALAVSWTR